MKNFKFSNILSECSTEDYCHKRKLIISKKHFDKLIDILADDILNPLKDNILFNTIFIEKSINYFKFIKRPSELITFVYIPPKLFFKR